MCVLSCLIQRWRSICRIPYCAVPNAYITSYHNTRNSTNCLILSSSWYCDGTLECSTSFGTFLFVNQPFQRFSRTHFIALLITTLTPSPAQYCTVQYSRAIYPAQTHSPLSIVPSTVIHFIHPLALINWPIDCHWLTDCLSSVLTDCLTDIWYIDWLTDWNMRLNVFAFKSQHFFTALYCTTRAFDCLLFTIGSLYYVAGTSLPSLLSPHHTPSLPPTLSACICPLLAALQYWTAHYCNVCINTKWQTTTPNMTSPQYTLHYTKLRYSTVQYIRSYRASHHLSIVQNRAIHDSTIQHITVP